MTEFKDDFFISLSDFVEELTDIDYYMQQNIEKERIVQTIESVNLETACQLMINVNDDDEVQIGSIPPLYYIETSVMPVFHSIKLKIELEE